jgi:GNAT superfamily N-acetyltransferase
MQRTSAASRHVAADRPKSLCRRTVYILRIREAGRIDLSAILDLYSHLHRQDDPATDHDIAVAWGEILANPSLHTYVGELQSLLVTSCTLVVVPSLRRGPSPYAFIENVVTRTNFRRHGYGTAVMKHALQTAWELNCHKVMLLTGRKDEETLRFYEQVGLQRGTKTGFVAVRPTRHNSALHPTARSAGGG